MKVVILAGGLGTRLSEETDIKPKPMVEIGGRPILWHIMKLYASQGFKEFIICCGYKGHVIKEYFQQYFLHHADVTFDLAANQMSVHHKTTEDWKVTLVNTGKDSMTGGRIRRIQPYVKNERFMLTYGDGLSNINLAELLRFHKNHGKMVTVTAVQPESRFGVLDINATQQVQSFMEKPKGESGWINGGFFICEPGVFSYLEGDQTIWEREPLEQIAAAGELFAFKHSGFWKPMDSLKDKNDLNSMWEKGQAEWNIWK
jgi:glucose-1-phosphate cytidylyltransferase